MEILNNNDSGDEAAKAFDFETVFNLLNLLEPHCNLLEPHCDFRVNADLATLLARLANCASFEVHIQTTKGDSTSNVGQEGKLTLDIVIRELGTTNQYEGVDWGQVAQTLIEFAQDQVKTVAALPNVWAMLKIIDFPTIKIVEILILK